MAVYRVEFTAKGYLEIPAPDPGTAYEKAMDIVSGMSSKTFMNTFGDDVEANEVEIIEEDVNPHDYYMDLDIG